MKKIAKYESTILYIILILFSILMFCTSTELNVANLKVEDDKKVIDSLTTENIYLYHENYIYDVVITKMCGDDSTFCIKYEEYKKNTE